MRHLGDPLSRRLERMVGWYLPGGAAFVPTDLTGLILWLKADTGTYQDAAMTTPASADNDPVGAWQDQSGLGNHVTQAAAGAKPTLKTGILNGLPVVRFATDFLSVAHNASLNLQAPISMAGVANLFSYGGQVRICFAKQNSWRLGVYTTRPAPVFTTHAVKDYFALDVIPLNWAAPFVVRFDAAYDVQFWWDSMWAGEATHNADVNTSADALIVGAATTGSGSPWQGDIFELMLYSAAVTDDEANQLLDYLNTRSGRGAPALLDNAAAALTIPTYDATNQVVHPDVYDAGSGSPWNGHRYWMAMTPYPNSNPTRENPSIVVSSDGTTWTNPIGITNPIDAYPGPPETNSDTDLLHAQDDKLYCYYRENDGATQDRILCRSSADGVNWGAETELFVVGYATALSPAVIWDGVQYVMWHVDGSVSPSVLYRRTSANPDSGWSAAGACTIDIFTVASRYIWHLDVILDGGIYHAFVVAINTGATGRLYYATSNNGTAWSVRQDRLINITKDGWDNLTIYRTTAAKTATGFDVWYSATTSAGQWYVGKTAMIV